MSKIMDIANAEAEEAEAAEDEPTEDESEPEAEVEDKVPAPAPVDAEKALAAIEKENVRHAARVAQIMGADFELAHPCPGCVDFAAGFTLTPPETAPPLVHGAEFERCGKCNGYGQVLTGAITEHGQTTTCRACSGQGYIEIVLPPAPLPPMPGQISPHASLANELRAQGFMVIDPPQPINTNAGQ